ncbi:DUF3048 domain-containing protein [Candidatus Parcubacteria bacterium]|jgi:hypothetical protein|nr:MAG: DUF3048 domain-containing protein [Candidatus Parcubacteria bacterium]
MTEKLIDSPKDFTFGKRKNRWPWLIGGGVAALGLIVFGGYLAFGKTGGLGGSDESKSSVNVPRKIDGVVIDSEKSNLFPLCMVIENHSSVRPQSGLSQAGVVYEALAEGGITRFLAVFAVNGVLEIGPVRSARPYLVDLAKEYNCLFVHAGASPQAETEIKTTNILDFNQFFKPYNFYRIPGRQYEHSLFTTLSKMELGRIDMGIKDRGNYEAWEFKEDSPVAEATVKNLKIDFSTQAYKVEYTYDAQANAYRRFQGGSASKDKSTDTEIVPKNVVVMYTVSSLYDELRRNITVVGEGKALVFQDGQVITGTWKKSSVEARLKFFDATGAVIKLNRGQTWVEVVDVPEKNVTY